MGYTLVNKCMDMNPKGYGITIMQFLVASICKFNAVSADALLLRRCRAPAASFG